MLANLAKKAPQDYVYERKADGFRLQAVCTGKQTHLFSRSGRDVTHRFPLLEGFPQRQFVLDGEVVAFTDGADDFAAVQRGEVTDIVLFDIMNLDGFDVRELPWHARRPLLDEVELEAPCVRLPNLPGDGSIMLQRASDAGWEGLVAKDPDAPYTSGRSPAWLKLKCAQGQEFVIGGFTDAKGGRRGFGALLVGYYDNGRLRYAGKVGTGFDDATLVGLSNRLASRERSTSPFIDAPAGVHWVEPELVARIDFTEWTAGGRLRHPRFLGIRDDKPAREVHLES